MITYIRADGNSDIGLGHLIRCISLASELRKFSGIVFLCGDAASAKVASDYGFNVKIIGCVPFSSQEAYFVRKILDSSRDNDILLILDSYFITNEYTESLQECAKIAVIDDMFNSYSGVDVIINYNCYAEDEKYVCSNVKKPVLLLGSEFIPLREQFSGKVHRDYSKHSDIMITMGGGDPWNITGLVAKRLLGYSDNWDFRIHLICGRFNPNFEELQELGEENPSVIIHETVKDMASMMENCDISISAGGSTCYELCAMGIPFVIVSYADNQIRLSRSMEEKGVATYAGHISDEKIVIDVVESAVMNTLELLNNEALRVTMGKKGVSLVDGCGAENLAKRLVKIMEDKA